MAVNRERPHVLVLPEDDATRSLAVGFVDATLGQMQVLNPVRGWPHVLEVFEKHHVTELRKYKNRHLVLLIDFDDEFDTRMPLFKKAMPEDVVSRVYVLGAYTEAETLKKATSMKLGPLGLALARECEEDRPAWWTHPQLKHNASEIQRLAASVKHFLF